MKSPLAKPPVLPFLALFATLIGIASCGTYRIQENGLKHVKLGEPMIPYGQTKLGPAVVRDTSFAEGEYEWPGAILSYDDGEVIVEGDFHDGASVNRIRVENPKFKTKSGLHVHSTVADLKEARPNWKIGAYPKYGLFEFFSPGWDYYHFLVKDPNMPTDKDSDDYHISQFDPNSQVVAIVIF